MKTLFTLLLLTSINIAYAQTCTLNISNNTPDDRYTNNNNGTITDNISKLVWKQCSEGQIWVDGSPDRCDGVASSMTWQAALTLAASTTFRGNSYWQLPNTKQLSSIVANNCYGPSINKTYFPNTPNDPSNANNSSNNFWSSTPHSNPGNSWFINFNHGEDNNGYRGDNHRVRLVSPYAVIVSF